MAKVQEIAKNVTIQKGITKTLKERGFLNLYLFCFIFARFTEY